MSKVTRFIEFRIFFSVHQPSKAWTFTRPHILPKLQINFTAFLKVFDLYHSMTRFALTKHANDWYEYYWTYFCADRLLQRFQHGFEFFWYLLTRKSILQYFCFVQIADIQLLLKIKIAWNRFVFEISIHFYHWNWAGINKCQRMNRTFFIVIFKNMLNKSAW